MDPDYETLTEIASSYMLLKQQKNEIREKLKAQNIDVPDEQANVDVEMQMQDILDNAVADNCHIEGITPPLRTSSDQQIGFRHLQVWTLSPVCPTSTSRVEIKWYQNDYIS